MKLDRIAFAWELGASVTTIVGIYIGSTTVVGACWYAVSLVFWYGLMFRRRLWGIAPLNVVSTIVVAVNLLKAMS
jgi:hypothetical protein